jgi:hypothetical protein
MGPACTAYSFWAESLRGSSTICCHPGYLGRLSSYLPSISLRPYIQYQSSVLRAVKRHNDAATRHSIHITHLLTNRPPRKCRPLKDLTPSLGAVSEIRTSGLSHLTPPSKGSSLVSTPPSSRRRVSSTGPFSTSHPLGISTLTMGSVLVARREMSVSKGARTGGWKEKPKIASSITS